MTSTGILLWCTVEMINEDQVVFAHVQHVSLTPCCPLQVSECQRDHANHALYAYTDPGSGQKRLAKFTGRYGTAVHAAWASAGLAPTLFDVTELDCHMLFINMELLPESWRVLSDLSGARAAGIKAVCYASIAAGPIC